MENFVLFYEDQATDETHMFCAKLFTDNHLTNSNGAVIVRVLPDVRAKSPQQAIAIARATYSRHQDEWEAYSNCYVSHENA